MVVLTIAMLSRDSLPTSVGGNVSKKRVQVLGTFSMKT